MFRRYAILSICAVSLLSGATTSAQGIHAVSPLEGYSCMQLNLSDSQMRDNSVNVPIRSRPDNGAPIVGNSSAILLGRSPVHEVDGFVEVLRLDGSSGWIEKSKIRPWRNDTAPSRRCVPSLMSNGRPGFAFR